MTIWTHPDWKRRTRHLGAVTVAAAIVLLSSSAASANSFGITSNLFGVTGCNSCHSGGGVPTVTLTGPTSVSAGTVSELRFAVMRAASQPRAGLNVSASGGQLSIGGADAAGSKLLMNTLNRRNEVTHNGGAKRGANNVVTFSFLWTAPETAGVFTLSAWGNAVNGDGSNSGDRAANGVLTVEVILDAPTPTATPTPTELPPTPTPSPTPMTVDCVGNCNGDTEVTIDELLVGVSVAQGSLLLDTCPQFDSNADREVTIDELLAAVSAALVGCG